MLFLVWIHSFFTAKYYCWWTISCTTRKYTIRHPKIYSTPESCGIFLYISTISPVFCIGFFSGTLLKKPCCLRFSRLQAMMGMNNPGMSLVAEWGWEEPICCHGFFPVGKYECILVQGYWTTWRLTIFYIFGKMMGRMLLFRLVSFTCVYIFKQTLLVLHPWFNCWFLLRFGNMNANPMAANPMAMMAGMGDSLSHQRPQRKFFWTNFNLTNHLFAGSFTTNL